MLTGTSCILRGSWSGMLASVQLVPSSWPTSAHWFAASLRSLHPTDPRIAHNRSRYRHEGDEMHVGSCICSFKEHRPAGCRSRCWFSPAWRPKVLALHAPMCGSEGRLLLRDTWQAAA